MAEDISAIHRQFRREGIFPNHRAIQPSNKCHLPPLPPITDIREPFQFSSTSLLPDLPTYSPLPSERLSLSAEAAAFLQLVNRLSATSLEHPEEPPAVSASSRRAYLEEPLTTGDFTSQVKARDVKPVAEDPELHWNFKDKGDDTLKWSVSVRRDVAVWEKTTSREKLDVEAPVLALLQAVCRAPLPEDEEVFVPKRKNLWRNTVLTPPLLPCEDLTSLPPLEDWKSDLQPLDGGPTSEVIANLTNPFVEEDTKLEDAPSTSSFLPGLTSSSPISPPVRREDPKIDAPLTPPLTVNKHVRFVDLVQDDTVLQELREPPTSPLVKSEFFEAVEKEVLEVQREVAQEQLQMADSTLRIGVPAMDFVLPKPVWEECTGLGELKAWAASRKAKWQGIKRLEVKLPYLPFSKEAARVPAEVFEEDPEAVKGMLVSEEDGETEEAKLVECMRTLDFAASDDDDEDLEEGVFEVEGPPVVLTSLGELTKKRKQKEGSHLDDLLPKRAKNLLRAGGKSSRFSATNSLDNFMAIRSGKAPVPRPETPPTSTAAVVSEAKSAPPTPKEPIPTPSLPSSPPKAQFIVSTNLLSNIPLFRSVRALYSTAAFIERDYTIPHPSGAYLRSPDVNTPTHSPIPDADLILSPTTGLVYVTLSALCQRPLPGDKSAFACGEGAKQNLQILSVRYDRIVLIVHSPSTIGSTSDSEALSSMLGFCAALGKDCTILVRIVEGGIEEAARWIAEAMMQARWEGSLVEDETLWELWLRRAGLNAFAAQEVVRVSGGLIRLIEMDDVERRRMLENIAGLRVAGRVGRTLEERWG